MSKTITRKTVAASAAVGLSLVLFGPAPPETRQGATVSERPAGGIDHARSIPPETQKVIAEVLMRIRGQDIRGAQF